MPISTHEIVLNFEEEAKAAIRKSYLDHGTPPKLVLVKPGLTGLSAITVDLGDPAVTHTIPIAGSDDLGLTYDGFALA